MPFLSDTIQGWQNVCIDGDCNFNKFKKIANIMETKLGIVFTQKINGPDTSYWDFYFYNSNLTLSYNIYEGITIFPIAFGAASEMDNTKH